jgi:PleD family two-component response regulator
MPINLGTTSVLITISVGVSTGITTAEDALVRAADDAMYESKHLGRNRVSAAADQPLAVAG